MMRAIQLDYDEWHEFMFFASWSPGTPRALVNMFFATITVIVAVMIPSMEILAAFIGTFAVLFYGVCIPLTFQVVMVVDTKPYGKAAILLLTGLLLVTALIGFVTMNVYLLEQVLSYRSYFQFS